MNKRQIEQRIKMEANQINIPDVKQEILAQIPNRGVVVTKTKKPLSSVAIRFSYMMCVLVVVLLTIVIVNNFGGEQTTNEPTENPTLVSKDVSNSQKAYAKGAATMAGFVDSVDGGVDVVATSFNLLSNSLIDYNAIAEEINMYFAAISRLLDEDNAVYNIEVLENNEYMYKLTIKNTILSDTIETIVCYNEETLDDGVINIDGVIAQGGEFYQLCGSQVIKEDECNIELTLKISDYNYITVSQEIEKNEKEFEYKFYYGNSKKAYKTISVEIESDENDLDGKKDVSVEIVDLGREIEIEFKYGKDNDKDHVDVIYHDNDDEGEGFQISQNEENSGQYRFKYKDKNGEDGNADVDKYFGFNNAEFGEDLEEFWDKVKDFWDQVGSIRD